MLSRRRVSLIGVVAAFALALPGSVSAANPITVEVIIGQSCISGSGPADKKVLATLRTPSGNIRGRFQTRSDDFGGWFGCFRFDLPTTFVNGGDRLRVEIGNQVRNVEVPRMVPDIDRVEDVIEGSARPFSNLSVSVRHARNFKSFNEYLFDVTADDQGNWRLDTTGEVNLRGGDSVGVFMFDGADLFGALGFAPQVVIGHASNFLQGTVNHRTRLEFWLDDAGGAQKAHVNAGPIEFGIFYVSMHNSEGDAAYPIGGDWLSSNLADDAQLRVPNSLLTGNAANDVIEGRCMPNAPYMLGARHRLFFGKTSSTGRFVRDVTNRMNLRSGDDLTLACMYPTGDIWARNSLVQ